MDAISSAVRKPNAPARREADARGAYRELSRLRAEIVEKGLSLYENWRPELKRRLFKVSALNLAHYLVLRQTDRRKLQIELSELGLSSLGRSEAHVLQTLDTVLGTLGALVGEDRKESAHRPKGRAFFRGEHLLRRQTKEAFGPIQHRRRVRIMVTLPSEAATDYLLVRDFILSGMDVARINCAHDTSEEWRKMIAHIRKAEAETGRRCKVEMDLCGPRARTESVHFTAGEQRLTKGQVCLLTDADIKAYPGVVAVIRCSLPGLLSQVGVGKHVYIDDGKIGTVVDRRTEEGLLVRVILARQKGERLAAEKALNFPDTPLHLSPLTEKDLKDLDFVAANADLIGYSFVQDPGDIDLLQAELVRRGRALNSIGVVAKIETRRAVENLPGLIVHGAGRQPFAVMIARGDLAVEVGWEDLAETQEEILWVCEAAHVPVVWATQVLEKLVKKGLPTRTEITDAAMSERAECVMLNKGPYLCDALKVLNEVLKRMQEHQSKKTPHLGALCWGGWVEKAIGHAGPTPVSPPTPPPTPEVPFQAHGVPSELPDREVSGIAPAPEARHAG